MTQVTSAEPAPAAAPVAKGRGGRKQTYMDDQIVVLKTEGGKNPKKEGMNNHERFAAMMRVMKNGRCTVAEAVKAGATRGDLKYDHEHGFIDILPPTS